jgi:hypothetical protein
MTATPEVETFAEALVAYVRDLAVQSCDAASQPHAQHKVARRWKDAGVTSKMLEVLIPDIVDDALFHLLDAIDNGGLALFIRTSDGELRPLEEEGKGEMAGWFMGHDGWRARYSKTRFHDDFADLA